MAHIRIDLAEPLLDGLDIKFKAPCNCSDVVGLKVFYPQDETTATKEFVFRDAHGNDLTGLGNLFFKDSYVKVIVDVENGYAYLQNADTNSYLESRMQTKHDVLTVTLAAANWSDLEQTIEATGITALTTIIVSPMPSNYDEYCEAGIYCVAQAEGVVTFKCKEVPSSDLVVYLLTLGESASSSAQAVMLTMNEDEGGYDVQATVGDETYGVDNTTVNQGATPENYDFTVL